jgi:Ni,Fe-hydrogenase maturation factor
MRIAVIDGQGGGIGKHIVEKIRNNVKHDVEIIALGTNAIATSLMLKSGANEGASGENAIIHNAEKVDYIIGTIAIIAPNSMSGELTSKMAEAISNSGARKILIPLNKIGIDIVGIKDEPLPHLIEEVVIKLKQILNSENDIIS